jgi:hypothetical protein
MIEITNMELIEKAHSVEALRAAALCRVVSKDSLRNQTTFHLMSLRTIFVRSPYKQS